MAVSFRMNEEKRSAPLVAFIVAPGGYADVVEREKAMVEGHDFQVHLSGFEGVSAHLQPGLSHANLFSRRPDGRRELRVMFLMAGWVSISW